jgi:hypothetical protein
MKRIDLTGQKFGRLTVLKRVSITGSRNSAWLCRCTCGNEHVVLYGSLRRGLTKSCGCLSLEMKRTRSLTHGYTKRHQYRAEYGIWSAMLRRCLNPNCPEFKNYGGRGIGVCKRWRKFENFLFDMGDRPPGMTLDRIENDGDYTPDNCRWTSRQQQMRNTRLNRVGLLEAIEKTGLKYGTVMSRIHRGWPQDKWLAPLTETYPRE